MDVVADYPGIIPDDDVASSVQPSQQKGMELQNEESGGSTLRGETGQRSSTMDMKNANANHDYGQKPSPRQKVPVGRGANHDELMTRVNKNITVMDHGPHHTGEPTPDATPGVRMEPMLPNSGAQALESQND